MTRISDERIIDDVRRTSKDRRKGVRFAIVALVIIAVLTLVGSAIGWRESDLIWQTVNESTEYFWLGMAMGALIGAEVGFLMAATAAAMSQAFFALHRGHVRQEELLLTYYDAYHALAAEHSDSSDQTAALHLPPP